MKNALLMIFAVASMMTGCVSRTYVNRNPSGNNRYGHTTNGHRPNRGYGYDHRYDRNW